MARIVDARRDLVDDERFTAMVIAVTNISTRQHADRSERSNHGSRNALGLDRGLCGDARGRARAGQDVALVLVLAEVVSRDLAFQAARRDHRHFAVERDKAFEDRRRQPACDELAATLEPSRIKDWPLPS